MGSRVLILRKPRSGCLEERTSPIQPIVNSFTGSQMRINRTRLPLTPTLSP
jgi:hypothetical protein